MQFDWLKIFLYLWVFGIIPWEIYAQNLSYPEEYHVVYNLSDDWQVYDENYGAYVPYIAKRHKNSKAMSFWLDLEQFQGDKLVFLAYEGNYLMINNTLCKQFNRQGWHALDIDSLGNIYKDKHIFCSFYDELPRLPLPGLFIAHLKTSSINKQEETEVRNNLFQAKSRKRTNFKYFITLQILLLMLFYTTTLNYHPKSLKGYFNWRSSLSRVSRIDSNLIYKNINGVTLLILTGHALIIALVYEILFGNTQNVQQEYTMVSGYTGYLQKFVWIMILIVMKYIFTTSLGLVLNMEKGLSQVHFFEYFRLSMLFYSILAIVVVFFNISFPSMDIQRIIVWVILLFHLIQAFLVSFYVLKQIRYTSLYLFYYLCITELIPLMVGIKFLLFSDLLTQNTLSSILYE